MLPGPKLRTDRLLLRRWCPDDREPFAALNADPDVGRFLNGPYSRAQSDALIDDIEAGFERRGFGLWAVEIPGEAPLIGFVGLAVPRFEAPFMPAVEIGWRLARPFWRQGYATEAARAALAFGFGVAGLSEVVSFTAVDNRRSQAVMRRLGMTRDPAEDFDMPLLPPRHWLRRHMLFRLRRADPVSLSSLSV